MALNAGDTLGPYQIVAILGEGGMGQVYRALDPRLGREVAIKVSSEKFTDRFEREAKAIASLNHPNICQIYDVGPNYLVMELVEGESPQGPLPLETVLDYARQMIDALDAAHEKGIVHRDLKPANLKVTADGTLKILDFGLAKLATAMQSNETPTITMGATQAGAILGTPAYMSPEQARGKPVDKRADIWAFGVILYDLLTGREPFTGETLADMLVSVVKEDADLTQVPPQVLPLIRQCLQKDPRKRLRDIGDATALLEQSHGGPISVAEVHKAGWIPLAVAGLAVVAFAALAFVHFREKIPVPETLRFQVPLPDKVGFTIIGAFAISPDGHKLAFSATGADAVPRLWLRAMDSLDAQPIPGTETSLGLQNIFWSPDSRYLAFQAENKLKKVDTFGGPVQTLCDAPVMVGGSWNRDGVIIFSNGGGVQRLSAAGGTPVPVTALDISRGENAHLWPIFLPDGQHFAYMRRSITKPENEGTFIGALDAKPADQSLVRLMANSYQMGFAAVPNSNSVYAVFLRDAVLFAQHFDTGKLALSGDPVPLAEPVSSIGNLAYFSVESTSALVYRTGANQRDSLQLTWINRKGETSSSSPLEPGRLGNVRLSPDGKRVAVVRVDQTNNNSDIWIVDLASGSTNRFTFDPANDGNPVWSPDGTRLTWNSNRGGMAGIYQKAASGLGSDELIYTVGRPFTLTDWSRDGRFLIYQSTDPKTRSDIYALPVGPGSTPENRTPTPLVQTPAVELAGYLSPDARWLAYLSDESGRQELYVQPFNGDGKQQLSGKWMVSKGALGMARWRSDGKELTYISTESEMMAVDITDDPTFRAGTPHSLFRLPSPFIGLSNTPGAMADAARDLQRFLLVMPAPQATRAEFTMVENWEPSLRR